MISDPFDSQCRFPIPCVNEVDCRFPPLKLLSVLKQHKYFVIFYHVTWTPCDILFLDAIAMNALAFVTPWKLHETFAVSIYVLPDDQCVHPTSFPIMVCLHP